MNDAEKELVSKISMSGRYAFCLQAFEGCLVQSGWPLKKWDSLLSILWERVWTDDFAVWEATFLYVDVLSDDDVSSLGEEVIRVRNDCAVLSDFLKDRISDLYEIGVEHSYSCAPAGVGTSVERVSAFMNHIREDGGPVPSLGDFLFSSISGHSGWGRISKGEAFSLRHPSYRGRPFSPFARHMMARFMDLRLKKIEIR